MVIIINNINNNEILENDINVRNIENNINIENPYENLAINIQENDINDEIIYLNNDFNGGVVNLVNDIAADMDDDYFEQRLNRARIISHMNYGHNEPVVEPRELEEQEYEPCEEQCSICLEDVCEDGYQTGCNHHFHRHCLHSWVNINTTCPNCRQNI